MSWIMKSDKNWVQQHGELKTGGWYCRQTKSPINQVTIGRSIHVLGMPGGFGEVRQVKHLYCTGCNPHFQPPRHGTPVQEIDLVEVT